jgi:hypothetical protein
LHPGIAPGREGRLHSAGKRFGLVLLRPGAFPRAGARRPLAWATISTTILAGPSYDREMIVPLTSKKALLVVRRPFFDAFASGAKTTEYRRHRPPFVERIFYPGRLVRIAYNYDINRYPTLLARVLDFDVAAAADHPDAMQALLSVYPSMQPSDEIALIGLALVL